MESEIVWGRLDHDFAWEHIIRLQSIEDATKWTAHECIAMESRRLMYLLFNAHSRTEGRPPRKFMSSVRQSEIIVSLSFSPSSS